MSESHERNGNSGNKRIRVEIGNKGINKQVGKELSMSIMRTSQWEY